MLQRPLKKMPIFIELRPFQLPLTICQNYTPKLGSTFKPKFFPEVWEKFAQSQGKDKGHGAKFYRSEEEWRESHTSPEAELYVNQ